jgi:hypothetical protein
LVKSRYKQWICELCWRKGDQRNIYGRQTKDHRFSAPQRPCLEAVEKIYRRDGLAAAQTALRLLGA